MRMHRFFHAGGIASVIAFDVIGDGVADRAFVRFRLLGDCVKVEAKKREKTEAKGNAVHLKDFLRAVDDWQNYARQSSVAQRTRKDVTGCGTRAIAGSEGSDRA